MTDTQAPIGPAICEAIRFLRSVHRDTGAVVHAIDDLMHQRRWKPTETKVASEQSNRLNPEKWIVSSLYRIYVPEDSGDPADRVMACHLALDPPAPASQPVCLCISALLSQPTTASLLWEQWWDRHSIRLITHLLGHAHSPSGAPLSLVKNIFPATAAGGAFLVPLCDLRTEPDVERLLVTPLLNLLPKTPTP